MRKGEKCTVTIHPRVAYGSVGHAELGVPPDCFLEYEVELVQTYEVCYLARGRVTKKTWTMPEMTGCPDDDAEVTIRWSGRLVPSGKLFQPKRTQTFRLNDESHAAHFDAAWNSADINGLKGHRSVGGYRASMYNALPLSSVEVLVDVMREFERTHG